MRKMICAALGAAIVCALAWLCGWDPPTERGPDVMLALIFIGFGAVTGLLASDFYELRKYL